ncbi:DUF7674 family protein [Flavobacterium sp.]|uniref:DUF7674 family protein n=1 Tax=Flavobacterium sp. TaxID=239 RepID=UPI004034DD63
MKNHATTACAKAARFAEITKELIRKGNIPRVRKCLTTAEQLLATGSAETKNAISNIYVFSVSTFMELHNCSIANLFPQTLRREYITQVNTSGV